MPKSQDKALVKLQEIDSGLDTARNNLDAIAEKERFDEVTDKLGQICDKLSEILEEIQKLEAEEKRREDEDGEVEVKIIAEERKMFSGKISNPKELVSIQIELDSLKKKKDDLDTKCLIGMEELDDKKAAQTALAAEESDLKRKAGSLERTYRKIEKKLNDFGYIVFVSSYSPNQIPDNSFYFVVGYNPKYTILIDNYMFGILP